MALELTNIYLTDYMKLLIWFVYHYNVQRVAKSQRHAETLDFPLHIQFDKI